MSTTIIFIFLALPHIIFVISLCYIAYLALKYLEDKKQ